MSDGVKFTEAIEWLAERLAMPPEEWLALVREVDAAAQDRSAGMRDSLFKDVLKAIQGALEQGTTAEQFRKDFDRLIAAHGWKGDNTAGWRSQLIFRVQTAQAMAAGRWRQIQAVKGGVSPRPWLRYVTVGDHRVRPEHMAWHNLVLHCDDPWWKTHFPPNGFQCRCSVDSLNDRDLERYRLTPGVAPPLNPVLKFAKVNGVTTPIEVPAGIDPGFAVNFGEVGLGG